MPRHNNSDVASRLRQWMGAQGPASIDTIAPELVPVVLAADLTQVQPSAGRTRFVQYYHTQAGVAANYAHVGIYNPASSDVDVLVDRVTLRPANTMGIWTRWHNAQTTWTLGGNRTTVDMLGARTFNEAETPQGLMYATNHTSVYGTIIMNYHYLGAATDLMVPMRVRLLPGKGIIFVGATVNLSLFVGAEWREVKRVS